MLLCYRTALPLKYVYDPRDPTPYSGGGWLNLRKDVLDAVACYTILYYTIIEFTILYYTIL